MVSEIHRPVLQALYLLNPVNEAKATYDYEFELIITFFRFLPHFLEEWQLYMYDVLQTRKTSFCPFPLNAF